MIEYDRIDISEGIDINKSNDNQKNVVFSYQPYPCNGCHDLMQKAMNFNDVAIVSVKVMIIE